MPYEYFVSCYLGTGFGNCAVSLKRQIETMDDVKRVEEMIEEKNGGKPVVVLNWKLLRED